MTPYSCVKCAHVLFSAALASAAASYFPASAHQAQSAKYWAPSTQLIAEVEAHLSMPGGSGILSTYARYYYGEYAYGNRLLIGEFVLHPGKPGIYVVSPDRAPKVLDGGCGVIDLEYDVERKKVISISCAGVA